MTRRLSRDASDISHTPAQWEALKADAAFDELNHPHRWQTGTPALGRWVLDARTALKAGRPVALNGLPVQGLRIVRADNVAPTRTAYQLSRARRARINAAVQGSTMVLAATNDRIGTWSEVRQAKRAGLVRTFASSATSPEFALATSAGSAPTRGPSQRRLRVNIRRKRLATTRQSRRQSMFSLLAANRFSAPARAHARAGGGGVRLAKAWRLFGGNGGRRLRQR